VIWAIASPDIEVLLVERKEKKAVFLEMLPRKLGLVNLSVRHADSRQLALEAPYKNALDVITTMGVGSPSHSVSLALPFLEPSAWLATARPLRDEPDQEPHDFSLCDALDTDDSRLVVYQRQVG
jgi:16S rRNA G527 N7-methylase RsmG